MFWGLIMEPNKRYTQTVEKAFHVSMATLDDFKGENELVQVMACYEGRNYLLCNLKRGSIYQVPLDLNFEQGTTIAFTSNGHGRVHLTGYLHPENLDIDEELLEEEAEDEEAEEDDDEEVPQLTIIGKSDKRKAKASPENAKQAKRQKAAEPEADDDEDEDEEISASSAESDSNEDGESDDAGDEEESEEEEEEEEEVVPAPQPVGKKNKQQQQENNQKAAKKQKNLVNGKEAKQQKPQQEQQQAKNEATNQQAQKKKVISGGVQVEELKVGTGAPAKPGRMVTVYYVGKLKNGKKFDSTTNGEGFKFRLGKGEVIKGWDAGVQGMKVGGKRRLTIPPAMAYGAKGSPPVIPGNSTLVFEVELRKVN